MSSRIGELWRRVLALFRRRSLERDLGEELATHIALAVEDHVRAGMDREEAHRQAMIRFGGVEAVKELHREARGLPLLESFARDVRYSFRMLRRDIGFTIGIVLLLAVGIGANVAVFSILNGIVLRPLPYRDPDRLHVVQERIPEVDETFRPVNPLHFLEWQARCHSFEDLALAEYIYDVNLTGNGAPDRVPSLRVTPNAFSLLGVSAQIGRTFVPEEGQTGRDTVAVISDGLWRRRFGADPAVVGKTIRMDGVESVIVGVLPHGFRYDWGPTDVRRNEHVDIYRPWVLSPPPPWWSWANWYSFMALGRLREGSTAKAAQSELDGIEAAIAADHFGGKLASLHLHAVLVPFHDWVTGTSREGLFLLMAAVGVALIVACLNIANLMLVRATARGREAGVRVALGASRPVIFRSVLIESGVLALAGAIMGIVLAWAFLRIFASIAPASLPRIDAVRIDSVVLLVALGLTFLATVAFGLLPALRMTHINPRQVLYANSRSFTDAAGSLTFRNALIAVEVALSTSLMLVAGLLLMSFVHIDAVDRGFDSTNLLTAEISLPALSYRNNDEKLRFYETLLERLRSEPGVRAAGVTNKLPLQGPDWGGTAIPVGENRPAEEQPSFQYRFVSPGYLEAMGIPIFTGRSFSSEDYPRRVAVLSMRAASLLWPEGNPIGRRFKRGNQEETSYQVVGLVSDVHVDDLADDPKPIIYLPLTATGGVIYQTNSIALRIEGDPSLAASVLRNAVAMQDRQLPVSRVQTMQQIESAALGDRRFQLVLIGTFAVASLLLAAVGTYSVLAYTVRCRAPELALKMALGAQRAGVMVMVLRRGIWPVFLGLGVGVAVALALGRFLSGLLFSVKSTDGLTIAIVTALTLAAALVACCIPARRAVRTSILEALRNE